MKISTRTRGTTLGIALAMAMTMLAVPTAGAAVTAQDTRMQLIHDANGLIPTGSLDADKKLAEAAKKWTESLRSEYWATSDELGKEGTKVFDKDRDAARKLKEAIKKLMENGLDDSGATALLDRLVQEDARLATSTISAAEAAGAEASKIEEAWKEVARAEKELADDKPDAAIDHFKKAWEKAFKALAEAIKDSATSGGGGGDYSVYTFWFIDTSAPSPIPFAVTGTNQSGTDGYTGRGTEGYIFLPDGTQMQLHVSCSDAFTDGTGDKSDPTEDSPYRVVNYTISKYKDGQLDKTCYLTGVPDLASISLELDYRLFGEGATGEWLDGDGDPVHYTGAQAEKAEYRFTVTNSGSVALSGVAVAPLWVGETCDFPEPLGPGETSVCITDFFPQAGTYARTATATAAYGGGTVSASDSAGFVVDPD